MYVNLIDLVKRFPKSILFDFDTAENEYSKVRQKVVGRSEARASR